MSGRGIEKGKERDVSMCMYGNHCKPKTFCSRNHPGRGDCKHGDDCWQSTCWYNHPTLLCHYRPCLKQDTGCEFRHPVRRGQEESDAVSKDSGCSDDEEERQDKADKKYSWRNGQEGFDERREETPHQRFIKNSGIKGQRSHKPVLQQSIKKHPLSSNFSKSQSSLADLKDSSFGGTSRPTETRKVQINKGWGDLGNSGSSQEGPPKSFPKESRNPRNVHREFPRSARGKSLERSRRSSEEEPPRFPRFNYHQGPSTSSPRDFHATRGRAEERKPLNVEPPPLSKRNGADFHQIRSQTLNEGNSEEAQPRPPRPAARTRQDEERPFGSFRKDFVCFTTYSKIP